MYLFNLLGGLDDKLIIIYINSRLTITKFKVVDKTHKELLEGATKYAEATNKLETMIGK